MIGAGLLLIGVVVLIYGRTIGFEFVPYDDPAFVIGNGYVNEGLTRDGLLWAFAYVDGGKALFHSGTANLWHPLTWVSHMVDVEVFGLNAGGHHLTNVLLHCLNGLLVFVLFSRLLKNDLLGFFVALLFVVHPLRVESVAWVSERKDVLSGAFFWAALLAVVLSWEQGSLRRKKVLEAMGLACFGLALMSKPSVVVLPILLVILEGWQSDERKWDLLFWASTVKRRWSWFVMAGLAAGVAVIFQQGGSHAYFMEHSSVGERLVTAASGIWFYLWRVIWPFNLSVEYPFPQVGLLVHAASWLALLGGIAWLWIIRGKLPGVFFGFLWFLVCLLPVSGIVYVGSGFTADRYLYLALVGPLVALVSMVGRERVVLLVPMAVFWVSLSWRQVSVWENGWTLFNHMTEAQPRSPLGWSNLGGMHQNEGDWENSVSCYRKAVDLNPKDYISRYNIGSVLSKAGDPHGAISSYQESLDAYPDYLPALKNLGILQRDLGYMNEAIVHFEKGVALTGRRDEVFLWLLCESELAAGNKGTARELWDQLQFVGPKNPAVIEGMVRASPFLK